MVLFWARMDKIDSMDKSRESRNNPPSGKQNRTNMNVLQI